jgi:surface antigen
MHVLDLIVRRVKMNSMKQKLSLSSIAAVALIAMLLSGCQTNGNQKEIAGTLLGAGLAVAAGTLIGAFAGRSVGQSLDRADKLYAKNAYQQAQYAPVGQPIHWSNPRSGNSGTVTPVREGSHQATGEYCREYQTTINVGGQSQSAYGTACRQPDGSWKVI